jgi:hypothetical protein
VQYSDDEKGICRTCGFFAKHPVNGSSVATPSYYEIEPDQRESGKVWSHRPDLTGSPLSTEPACFDRAADLRSEASELIQLGNDGTAKEVCNKDRACEHWYPYSPGFSPKEHMEDLKLKALEQDRREFELKLFNISQQVQADSKGIAEESRRIAASGYRFGIISNSIMAILAAVQIWLAIAVTRGVVNFDFDWLKRILRFILPHVF